MIGDVMAYLFWLLLATLLLGNLYAFIAVRRSNKRLRDDKGLHDTQWPRR